LARGAKRDSLQNMQKEALLWAGAGLLGGLVVGALVGAAQSSPAVVGAEANAGLLQNVSAGGTLQPSWMYYLTMNGPGASNVQSLESYLQSLGFVDASSGGIPLVTSVSPTQATALAIYSGTSPGALPANTSNLAITASGYPTPSVLSA
jgi:hypothetical protein